MRHRQTTDIELLDIAIAFMVVVILGIMIASLIVMGV